MRNSQLQSLLKMASSVVVVELGIVLRLIIELGQWFSGWILNSGSIKLPEHGSSGALNQDSRHHASPECRPANPPLCRHHTDVCHQWMADAVETETLLFSLIFSTVQKQQFLAVTSYLYITHLFKEGIDIIDAFWSQSVLISLTVV